MYPCVQLLSVFVFGLSHFDSLFVIIYFLYFLVVFVELAHLFYCWQLSWFLCIWYFVLRWAQLENWENCCFCSSSTKVLYNQ